MDKLKISPIGTSWNEFEKDIFTPEEIVESNLRIDSINEIIQAQEKISQTSNKELKES